MTDTDESRSVTTHCASVTPTGPNAVSNTPVWNSPHCARWKAVEKTSSKLMAHLFGPGSSTARTIGRRQQPPMMQSMPWSKS